MEAPTTFAHHPPVKFFFTHVLRMRAWRYGTEAERREIEIRFCLARRLRARRRRCHVTQKQLATLLGAAQSTISKLERASPNVSMDVFVRAMIALGADDVEIAVAFNAGGDAGIQRLRIRAQVPGLAPRDWSPAMRRLMHAPRPR